MSQPYEFLNGFLSSKMRMSHIYQPLFIKALLESNGLISLKDLAQIFLSNDISQIEYYESIIKGVPQKTLLNHDVIDKVDGGYRFKFDIKKLSFKEKQLLISLCEEKIANYIDSRENSPWNHRKNNSDTIPGSLRYRLFKRAKSRCEACGVSSEDKALDIDHIIPRSKGGTNDESNLQVLCYSCNRGKRDTDDTDFSAIHQSYSDRDDSCIFCTLPVDRIVNENELAIAIRDGFPVTEGHTLVIPKRHVADYFDLYQPELNAINQLVQAERDKLLSQDKTITGFNVGVNAGQSAGQTVFHVHIHLIPRRDEDMENPKGGVRGVIPAKQKY